MVTVTANDHNQELLKLVTNVVIKRAIKICKGNTNNVLGNHWPLTMCERECKDCLANKNISDILEEELLPDKFNLAFLCENIF